jgi:undecaprenyl-diphosphatase
VKRERFLANPHEAAWTGAALVGAVALGAIFVPIGPLAIDRSWADAMSDVHSEFLRHLALAFNSLGLGFLRWLTIGAIAGALLAARRWLALAAFAFAEALAPLLSSLLKALVDRPRPPAGLVHPVGSSYPSGHATYAGTTAVALVLLFTPAGPRRRPWWAAACVVVALMGWSRTYLQVHWLSDVVAGSLLGVGIALAVFGGVQWKRAA